MRAPHIPLGWRGLILCATLLAPAAPAQSPAELEPGISFRVYQADRELERVHEPAEGVTPNVDELRMSVDCRSNEDFGGMEDRFIVVAEAFLQVSAPGLHRFRVTSDDGSLLTVGGETVLWNRGIHAATPLDGSVELEPGLHALRLLMFENAGEAYLTLEWMPPGAADFALLGADHLRTEAAVTRVVSPGPKPLDADVAGLRAGDRIPLESAHPAWRVETLHPDDFDPMVGCMALLPDGRLVIGSFEPKNNGVWLEAPNGTLSVLGNLEAEDPNDITVEVFAEGFYHPLGMCVVDGDLYVAQRDEITRMRDADGDGRYEERETFAAGWISNNYHHFTFGLEHHEGFLYASLSTSIGHAGQKVLAGEEKGINGPNPPNRGTLMRISLETGEIEYLCGGFRTPNGILVLPTGEVLVTENQGAWMPANKINHARPGQFYGHYNETRLKTDLYPEGGVPSLFSEQPTSLPAVWLPQNEICNSPTEMVFIPDGDFAGQLYVGELKLGGIRRVFLEDVDGVLQGAAFRFCQGFEGGVNRLLWAPDGSLIVGCIGETATWSWRGTRTGLQRLAPGGGHAFEIHSMSATEEGFEIRFTDPVPAEQLADPAAYELRQWRYVPVPEYGGPKVDEEALEVTAAVPASDRRSVRITVPGLEPGRCVYLRTDPSNDRGETIWSPEAWYTLNRIPGRAAVTRRNDGPLRALLFTKTAGFRHGSIAAGAALFERLSEAPEFESEHTEDAGAIQDENLQRFDVVVFLNTTGDVLDLSQEAALRRFIEGGGGFVGVHAAADTEYDWPWYGQMIGAYFRSHPRVQPAEIVVVDGDHPATARLPARWKRRDEWYDYRSVPPEGVRVLLRLDESSYEGGLMGEDHPIAWCQELGEGRAFYTGLGHTPASYEEAQFIEHLLAAMRWSAGH